MRRWVWQIRLPADAHEEPGESPEASTACRGANHRESWKSKKREEVKPKNPEHATGKKNRFERVMEA
jgi:hypothetical protein